MFMRCALLLLTVALGAGTVVCAADSCLLSSSAPGAFAVRYWPDRVVLTSDAGEAVRVTVRLPQAPKWGRLDGERVAAGELAWDARTSSVTVKVPEGRHEAHVAWEGTYQATPRMRRLPVMLDGKRVGSVVAEFSLERMQAEGMVAVPRGLVRPLLRLKAGDGVEPVLTVGTAAIGDWSTHAGELRALRTVAAGEQMPISLTIESYNLLSSPVEAIVLEMVQRAVVPERLEAMPAQGIVIEAEDFVAEGLGKVAVSDRHFQAHGGKSIYQNSGDGHWLEYRFAVPQAGSYELYARAATQEDEDLRSFVIDGKTAEGLGLVLFPGTGGWGYAASDWAALRLTTGAPLKLGPGEHTLRVTGESSSHLNLDYFVLVAR